MSETNICKNCGNTFIGKYCNNCGEKVYSAKDKSLLNLFSEGFHFITHFEGTLFTTLKAILFKPGKLSLDFCNGERKKYYKPLSFFLLIVILYLIFPFFEGLNMKLHFHENNDLYGNYASGKIQEVMAKKNISFPELELAFHKVSEKASKFLLFIIIPFLAIVSWIFGFKKRKLYYDHFIFSTELSIFYVLWGYLIFPLIILVLTYFVKLEPNFNENIVGLIIMTVFAIYTFIASKRFFNFNIIYNLFYTLIITFMINAIIIFIYKFILFVIGINLV